MAVEPKYSAQDEQKLMTEMWSPEISDDPYAYVMFAYPWGEKGPLENFIGPRQWQKDELRRIRDHIGNNRELLRKGDFPIVYKSATSSGRGVGKSALVAWLNNWLMSCVLGSTSITTANTETQLKSRTWAELKKWHTISINSHWFERTALSMKPASWFAALLRDQLGVDDGYYYAQAQLWSEENPDAFAGAHNHYGIMYQFDEASGIPPNIWSVVDGVFTEPILHRYWFCFSNPRRPSGEFFECFHKAKEFWYNRNLDSRSVEGTDVNMLNNIVKRYGDDSDEARVEVKGQFPRQGDSQFISRELVDDAVDRELQPDPFEPLIMGVDVARFGDDSSVIFFRQGRDARSIPPVNFKGLDNMALANKIAYYIDMRRPDAVCIDAGNGTGVIDRLRQMKYRVHEVWFGGKSEREEYANARTCMWADIRDWLPGGCLPDCDELISDLVAPEYRYRANSDKILLEPKDDMKKRGLRSTDWADAMACTFAVKISRRDANSNRRSSGKVATGLDYDIFG